VAFLMDFFGAFWFLMLPIGMIIGILLAMMLQKPARNEVIKLNPDSHKGAVFTVTEETANLIYCPGFGEYPNQRFLKVAPSYTLSYKDWMGRRKMVQRWLAREGRPATTITRSELLKELNLAETLKTLWGVTGFDGLPDPLKKSLNDPTVNVTVQVAEPLDPHLEWSKLKIPSEESVTEEMERKSSKLFFEGQKDMARSAIFEKIAYAGLGAAVAVVGLLVLGYIRPPGLVDAPKTAKIILWAISHVW